MTKINTVQYFLPKFLQTLKFLPLIFLCCSNPTSSDDLIGTWQITDFQTNAKLSEELLEEGRKRITSTHYELLEENKLVVRENATSTVTTGTWLFKPDSNLVELQYDYDPYDIGPYSYLMKSYDGDQMIWTTYEKRPVNEEYVLHRIR